MEAVFGFHKKASFLKVWRVKTVILGQYLSASGVPK